MKQIFTLVFLLASISLFSQTVLIDPTGAGGFENGTNFAANGWNAINDATTTWQVGTASFNAGVRGAYVSNDGGTTNAYTTGNSETSHFGRNITVPAGESEITLSFSWKCYGEGSFDRILVYTAPTTVTPVAGAPISSSTTITGATLVGTYNLQSTWQTATITLDPALAGTTFRLFFTWQNDGSLGTQPPGSIDDISLISQAPYIMSNSPITTCSGLWCDDGGYSANYTTADYTQTFTPASAGNNLQFVFNNWAMGDAQDYLSIYDGPNTGSPLIGTFNNASGSPGTITATNGTGQLTFYWFSDNNGLGAGWEASISCVPPPPANDNCGGAIALTVNPDYACGTVTSGTVAYATQSSDAEGCFGTSDDDVWYSFTATGTEHRISLINIAGSTTDMYWSLYSGSCGSLTELTCSDANSADVTGLSGGTTYYVRVYTYTSTPGQNSTFDVCIGTPPPPPPNDECAGAIALTVNPDQSCAAVTSSYTNSATNSGISACVGSGADDDVWFSFTATSTSHEFTIDNITGTSTDMVHEIFSGNCGSLSSIACSDPNTSIWGGFTIGQVYYVRVYTYFTSGNASFDICVGTPPPPPSNDDPCGATPLLVNSGSCSYQTADLNVSATATPGIPAPGCGSLSEDIWFTAVVPASGRLIIDIAQNGGPTDFDMAWYSAPNCSGPFTLIECDSYDSQDGSNPMICRTGAICTVPGDCQQNATLTPGQTVYVRVWEYGGGTTGPFDICAYEPAAPGAPSNCSSPTNIASLPFAQGNTTCCRNDDYTSADGCGSSYQDGEDFMYTYTPSANETIDITLTGTLSYTGVFVTDRCPSNAAAVCVGSSTNASGNPLLCGVNLTGGTTYYIMIDTDPTPTCTPFNISITESSTPSCGLNYSASSIAFAPDLNNGTNISLPVDDRFSSSYIPIGFPFCYDGFQHTQLLVSSNAYVIFDPIGCASNLPSANASPGGSSGWDITANVPNTTNAPRNCIMFPFHDVYPSNGGTIKYQTLGTAPNRRFVLTFFEVPYFSCTSLLFTGQLKLYETTNDIEIHIDNKESCAWNEDGAILGLHSYNGTTAVVPSGYNYSTPYTINNQAWRFTCNCVGCVVLPVELVEFTGEKISSKTNYLKWTTATELNNDYFEVERRDEFSEDFVTLDRIDGAGNSNALLHYSYTDIDAPAGAAYYRLKQVDTDGKYAYSSTIVIGDINDLADINAVYPNPATDRLNIKLNSDGGEIKISLVAMNGQVIVLEESTQLYGFNEISYDVTDVPPGFYYLRISSLKNEIYYKEKIVIE
ncbi:MAG: T9SS type A sorting domain-containing protein [Bacteroidales bacterium]|nr:T9SS type A sorting domain-containing protein [Bacteroidales bacterium]